MNEFIEIKTPFDSLKTVKLAGSETFRPAATGCDKAQLRLRTLMEALEIEASANREPGFVASAAHPEQTVAIKNAHQEANERISMAAWWAFDRPICGRALDADIHLLRKKYQVPQNYGLVVGFVEPTLGDDFVAVSILMNRQQYPYAVLGASSSENAFEATEKAFIESVQSWSASVWEKEQGLPIALWDIGELNRRFRLIEQSFPLNQGVHKETTLTSRLQVGSYSEGYVAWVYAQQPVSGRTASLARLAMRSDESFYTFTDHNQ